MTRHPSAGGHIPRVARLLALAHRFDRLIADGVVADYAELARLGHVSRARISQIMSLLHLAPDLQEAVLFTPAIQQRRHVIALANLLRIAAPLDWNAQRLRWQSFMALPTGGAALRRCRRT